MTDREIATLPYAPFEVLAEERGDAIVLCLLGEMDTSNAHRLAEAFATSSRAGMSKVVVDVAGLNFCDSSAVHALLRIADHCDARDVGLSVVGARGIVRRVLEIAAVEECLHLAPE
jgi:anti-sigma B factor antagonist